MTAPDVETPAAGTTPRREAGQTGQGTFRRGHRLGPAVVAIPARAVAGLLDKSEPSNRPGGDLPPPLEADRREIATPAGRVTVYAAAAGDVTSLPPLLLIHSINAAGTAYEIKPIWDRLVGRRAIYALDLPGFGLSDRMERLYTPRFMTDAILAVVDDIRGRHDGVPPDAMALSLSSEFLARAASERPEAFRSIGLVSPTGFDGRGPRNGPPESNRGMPALYKTFTIGLWRRPLFNILTSRVSIRYFLEKTWGSKAIDEGLFNYDILTTRRPGAEHAPYSFISGFLFSNDISRIYDSLTLPVWMVHGIRGDFVDYSGKVRVETLPNWTIDVLETGALPHFEAIDRFMSAYDTFMNRVSGGTR